MNAVNVPVPHVRLSFLRKTVCFNWCVRVLDRYVHPTLTQHVKVILRPTITGALERREGVAYVAVT